MYENGHHLHHYLSTHHTPPTTTTIHQSVVSPPVSEPVLENVRKSSENNTKVAFVAPLEARHENVTKNGEVSSSASSSPERKMTKELEMTRIELEYKLKEKQQLLEIELLRQRLAETERAMANIISKMDMIPTQAQKVRRDFLKCPCFVFKKVDSEWILFDFPFHFLRIMISFFVSPPPHISGMVWCGVCSYEVTINNFCLN